MNTRHAINRPHTSVNPSSGVKEISACVDGGNLESISGLRETKIRWFIALAWMFCVVASSKCFGITTGDYVRCDANVASRTGAGTGYAEISNSYYSTTYKVNPGSVGIVVDGPISANGFTWWQVTW